MRRITTRRGLFSNLMSIRQVINYFKDNIQGINLISEQRGGAAFLADQGKKKKLFGEKAKEISLKGDQ